MFTLLGLFAFILLVVLAALLFSGVTAVTPLAITFLIILSALVFVLLLPVLLPLLILLLPVVLVVYLISLVRDFFSGDVKVPIDVPTWVLWVLVGAFVVLTFSLVSARVARKRHSKRAAMVDTGSPI